MFRVSENFYWHIVSRPSHLRMKLFVNKNNCSSRYDSEETFLSQTIFFKILSTFFLILNLRLIKQYYLRYLLVPFLVLGNWFNKVKLQLWLFFQGLIQANPSCLTLTCGSWYAVASNYQKLGPFSARCSIFQSFIIEKKC